MSKLEDIQLVCFCQYPDKNFLAPFLKVFVNCMLLLVKQQRSHPTKISNCKLMRASDSGEIISINIYCCKDYPTFVNLLSRINLFKKNFQKIMDFNRTVIISISYWICPMCDTYKICPISITSSLAIICLAAMFLSRSSHYKLITGYFFTGEPLPHNTFKNLKIKLCLKQLKAYALSLLSLKLKIYF